MDLMEISFLRNLFIKKFFIKTKIKKVFYKDKNKKITHGNRAAIQGDPIHKTDGS
jgi:hypothetical protein